MTLNEALNIDAANSQAVRPSSPIRVEHEDQQRSGAPDLPPAYNSAAPLNEAELLALLMASPLYQKLENIRKSMEKGVGKSDGKDSVTGMLPIYSLIFSNAILRIQKGDGAGPLMENHKWLNMFP